MVSNVLKMKNDSCVISTQAEYEILVLPLGEVSEEFFATLGKRSKCIIGSL